jgi:predicted MFS family arabinose efflux permease
MSRETEVAGPCPARRKTATTRFGLRVASKPSKRERYASGGRVGASPMYALETAVSFPASEPKPVPSTPIRGLRSYLAVLRSPGVLWPAVGAAVASVPIGMLGPCLLLLVQSRSGNFAAAGVVVAVLGVGTGMGMIVQGRLLDSIGPRRVLIVSSAVRAAASIGFVVVVRLQPPLAVLAIVAFVIGMSETQVSSALRAMWPLLLPSEMLPAANAVSSVLFELPVVAGPLLLALVAAVLPLEIAVLSAGVLAVTGAWTFAYSAAARRWLRRPSVQGPLLLGPLAIPAVRMIVLVMSVPGMVLGVVQVSTAATATAAGVAEEVGMFYALLTAGSLLGTVLYGSRARPVAARWHLPALLIAQSGSVALAAAAPGVGKLAACVFVFGLFNGPVAVRCFIDLERHAAQSPAAAITVVIAGGLAATSLGSAGAGWVVDVWGTPPALLTGSGLLLVLAGGSLLRKIP